MVKVYCVNTGGSLSITEGTTLLELADSFGLQGPYPPLAAKVNNVVQGLGYRIYNPQDVEFLDYRSYIGRGTYCRSLCFLLSKACSDLFPECRVTMRRPISKGFFCHMVKSDSTGLVSGDVEKIVERMKVLVKENLPFHRHEVRRNEAVELFSALGKEDKVKILQTGDSLYTVYYSLDGTPDMYYDALVPSTSYLSDWDLKEYRNGMILRVPDRHHPEELAPFLEQPKTFDIFSESMKWNSIMGLDNVGDLNMAIRAGEASRLIQVSEALQEKKIVQIAEEIERLHHSDRRVRLVLITGPSSSGKTTVCKRLSVQLLACGLHPISFSTDDYFVNRVDTPKLPDGSYDFDNFDTVDHDALQKDVLSLLSGEEVMVPEFNFVTGIREYNGRTLRMEPQTILLVEGIHALNPSLTSLVPDECKFRVFINAITSIALDDHNCIPTSDNRLLRRIVRDYNNGSFSAVQTISQWPNVRRAEVKWIYPFQEMADAMFNSAYLVEFAVLRNHAGRILGMVPRNAPEYGEARRLLDFLNYFLAVSDKEIPPTSLLREFVGGSSFKY